MPLRRPTIFIDRFASLAAKLSLRAKSLLALAVPLALLVHVGILGVLSLNEQSTRDRQQLERAEAWHTASQQFIADLYDANARMNAYVTTGRVEYLNEYRTLEESYSSSVRKLRQAGAKRTQNLSNDTQQFFDALAALIKFAPAEGSSSGGPPGQELASARRTLEAVRTELAAMDRALAAPFTQESGPAFQIALEIVLALLAGFGAVWLLLKSAERDRQRAAQVEAQTRALNIMAEYEVFKAEMMGEAPKAAAAVPLAPVREPAPPNVLQSVLNSMTDGVVILNAGGTCLFSNPAAETMLGRNVAGAPLSDWGENLQPPLVEALRGSAVQRTEIPANTGGQGGGIWLSASATPLRDDAGLVCGAVGVFIDISGHRYTEDALNRAKEEAERANRAKSEFLSRMSHELRTPLNAILGFAQLLHMARLPEHHQDSVEQILKGGRHLLSLINEVLDIARIESGRLSLEIERLCANDVVQEAVLLVEPQAAKQKIQLYIEAGSAWRLHISADRQRFKQVVLNIVSNAVKYNREGGSVRISVEAREQHLRLSVADTGPGIPADKIGLLFSPFERLGAEHAGVEGSGIGLALSKRLVEAMAGRIGVHSEFGNGTTFWVEFPVADAVVFTDAWAREDLGRLHSGVNGAHRPVVLCIEDNDSNYRLIERTLAQRPEIKLICGALGETAVPLAELHAPDLILLDMHLPDLEGYDVLGRLRANAVTNGIPVVVVSADATTPQIERMLNAGAAAYLTKPLEIQKLLAVVDEAIGKGAQNKVVCLET